MIRKKMLGRWDDGYRVRMMTKKARTMKTRKMLARTCSGIP